jgi:hypothetical protein
VAAVGKGGAPSPRQGAATPGAGRSVAGAIGPLIVDVHAAVDATTSRLRKSARDFPWLDEAGRGDQLTHNDSIGRAAWATVAITMIEALATGRQPSCARALAWFEETPAEGNWEKTDRLLGKVTNSPDASSLFPYLLDPFGRTSRLDVIRDPTLTANRHARKEVGSFYTPGDVADFMVKAVSSAWTDKAGSWFDPACGSGIFLAAAYRLQTADLSPDEAFRFATNRLFGTDISPQACDFAAFAIVHAMAVAGAIYGKPQGAWVAIRDRIVAADSLPFATKTGRQKLLKLLPTLLEPIRFVCNPPYAGGGGNAPRSMYLPFVEMAWQIANGPDDSSCLVVPLALAANVTADHRRLRTTLIESGGAWTMLFFDRQPQALFGEDAKTRSAIIVRRPGSTPATIRTSGLLKWTSRQRGSILSEDRSVALDALSITEGIPKLSAAAEVDLYRALTAHRWSKANRPTAERAAPNEIVGTALSTNVFVGGTAYNFLSVFRNYPDKLSWRGTLSSSGVHKLAFVDGRDAAIATALLSSRIAFWLWHVQGDGFHVPSWFLSSVPLLDIIFADAALDRLEELGASIWAGLQSDILTSVNGGKVTFTFRPSAIETERVEVDSLILEAVGAPAATLAAIEAFNFRVVSIDGSTRRARPSSAHVKLATRKTP